MLTLDRGVYDAIVEHAVEGKPAEVCGVLGGQRGEERSHASTAERTDNVASSPRTEYEMGPEEQLGAMESIEGTGEDIIGFYHSHPAGPPRPSETDAARATWPGHSYVIVVLDGTYPFVGSWRWTGETFEGERVRIE